MSEGNVIVSTTPQISGWQITAHLDIVTAHIVAGTSIFSDTFASFSDIFGGRSRTYQRQLAEIDEEVVRILKERADKKGANGIVGLQIDHDPISSGGKSMFMVTASGTAVQIKPASETARRVANDAQMGYTTFAENEDEWRCRCGSLNEPTQETCPDCGRSANAII